MLGFFKTGLRRNLLQKLVFPQPPNCCCSLQIEYVSINISVKESDDMHGGMSPHENRHHQANHKKNFFYNIFSKSSIGSETLVLLSLEIYQT